MLANVIELILFAYLLPFAYHYVHSSYISKAASPAVGIPMWILQSITLVSFVLTEIRIFQKLIIHVKQVCGKLPIENKFAEQNEKKEGGK